MSTAAEAKLVEASNELADALDSFAGCFGLERNKVAYVSTPITTGKRYYDWLQAYRPHADSDFDRDHAGAVIAVNQESARALVERSRRQLDKVVIDPTPLEAPHWTQLQFHAFWTRLITDYAGTVVFNKGWEYSTGCCYEFAAAVNVHAKLLDDTLSPLAAKDALTLTKRAIERLRKQNHRIEGLLAAREAIEQAIAATASTQEHEV